MNSFTINFVTSRVKLYIESLYILDETSKETVLPCNNFGEQFPYSDTQTGH